MTSPTEHSSNAVPANEGAKVGTQSSPEDASFHVEQRPAVADVLFGDRVELASGYAELLTAHGEELGLLGPLEYPRLWTRHIVNSALIAPLLEGRVADVGSGAGLPGIPLAIARPDVEFTLIEPMERRANWLSRVKDELSLDNVIIKRARAEELTSHQGFDQVTARAVAALSKLIPWTAPLARYDGELLLLKGKSAEAEIEKAAKMIRKFHLEDITVQEVGTDMDTEPTRVVRARVR